MSKESVKHLDISSVIEHLIKNTSILLEILMAEKNSSESQLKRLLLLQHLSVLLTALEKADIPLSCIPELIDSVMPITQHLTTMNYGNTALRYHDWTIRLLKPYSNQFTEVLSAHFIAKGDLVKQVSDDKLDESKRSHPESLNTTDNMISSLRDYLAGWQLNHEQKTIDKDLSSTCIEKINKLEMEFLYQVSLDLLANHQSRFAPGSTMEPFTSKWTELQTTVIRVAQRLQTKDGSLAWHLLYTLQQSAPSEPEWQRQLLYLLLPASQQILGQISVDTAQKGDWQRYRANLDEFRQNLIEVLTDMKNFSGDSQPRLAAAEIYSQKNHSLIKAMMEECTQLLGPPPGRLAFCFLILGSFSRQEALPHSDFELICLVGDEKHTTWNHNDSRAENRYLAAWYDYFQFKMISAGLRLDEDSQTKGHPADPELRQTPAQLIAKLCEKSDTADKLYYSLLNPQYLYGVDGEALLATYQQELKNFFTIPPPVNKENKYESTSVTTTMQLIATRHLEFCYKDFQRGQEKKKSAESLVINLKEDYWEPLIYLVHHLALYYGKTSGTTQAAIAFLAENKLITTSVAEDLRTAVTDLYQLRWRQHHQRHVQHEIYDEKISDVLGIESQRLRSIKNRLLIPGYHALSNWLRHHEWPNDPFTAYWCEQLPVWLEAKSLDKARIDHVIDFLGAAQIVNPDFYQQAYQRIIDIWPTSPSTTRELTKYFYEQLCIRLKTSGFPSSQYRRLTKIMGDMPLPDGTRWWRLEEELLWRKALAAHWLSDDSSESLSQEISHYQKKKLPLVWTTVLPSLISNDEKKPITSTTRHLLKAVVAEKLIDSHGRWLATPGLPGRRPVIAYPNHHSPNYYIKPFPELPGNEYAVHALAQRWMGEATAKSQPVTLTFTDYKNMPLPQHPRPYPVLISEAILQADTLAGNHFETALLAEGKTSSPLIQAKLDPFHFTQWFLLSLLIHPEDGTPHNFVITQIPSGQYRLIGIDNDHHFVRPFFSGWLSSDNAFIDICTENKLSIPTDPNARQLLQVKTILYCLDQMQAPLDPQAVTDFLALDFATLLTTWLEDLVQWDQHHRKLLGEAQNHYLEGHCDRFSYIRPIFGSQTMPRLYQTSERLRRFLLEKDQSSSTHLDCLRRIHPLIGRRYLPLHENSFKNRSPIGRFKYLTDELKKIRSHHLPSSLSGRDILGRMEEKLGEESLIEQIKHQTAHHPGKALKYLRRYIEEKKPLEQIITDVRSGTISPVKLIRLFSTDISSPIHRAEILKAVQFTQITKREQSAIFKSLSRENYEILDISEVRGLSQRDWKEILLESVNLQRLSLKSCSGIRDGLLVNLAEGCMTLTELTLSNVSIQWHLLKK
jgi:hypothetical protein